MKIGRVFEKKGKITPIRYKGTIIPEISQAVEKDKLGNNQYKLNLSLWKFGRKFNDEINNMKTLINLGYRVSHPCPRCMGSNELPLCAVCDEGNIYCDTCNVEGNADWPGNYPCDLCNEGWEQCDGCEGAGRWDCDDCNGDGKWDCDDCDGKGESQCGECKGIEESCETCEGKGIMYDNDLQLEVYCDDCKGGGVVICYTCNNSGKVGCDECGGDGKQQCDYCRKGTIYCEDCDGDGGWSCEQCYDGWIECGECDEGFLECPACIGEWEADVCDEYWVEDDYHSYEAKQRLEKYKNISKIERDDMLISHLKNTFISYLTSNIKGLPFGKDREVQRKVEITNIRKQIEPLSFRVRKLDSYGDIDLMKSKFNSVSFVFIANELYPSIKRNKLSFTGKLFIINTPTINRNTILWASNLRHGNIIRWSQNPHYLRKSNKLIFDKSKITIIETGLKFRDNLFVNWVNKNPMDVKE